MRLARIIAAVVAMVFMGVSHAHAIERVRADKTQCATLQTMVDARGAIIVQYPSKRVANHLLYDRYVSNGRFCPTGTKAKRDYVPAADGLCRLTRCLMEMNDDCDGPGPLALFCKN